MVDGQLNVSKVLDAASEVDALLVEEMKKVQGKEEPFYPMFADFAEQAVLIAGVMVAEKNDQRKDSGRLRINANDLALQNSKDALFLTGFWHLYDVSNRYPMRAQDMLHRYRNDFRAFKVAGHPLGTLQISLGRSAGVRECVRIKGIISLVCGIRITRDCLGGRKMKKSWMLGGVLVGSAVLGMAVDVQFYDEALPITLNPLFATTMVDHRAHELYFDRLYYNDMSDNSVTSRLIDDSQTKIEDAEKIIAIDH